MLTHLIAYGLRQVVGESTSQIGTVVARYFGDSSQALPRALSRANDRAWQALAVALAGAVAPDSPNLARLLKHPTPGGPPLLVVAFAHFFRREVETDPELARRLTFDGLQRLSAGQEAAFGHLDRALGELQGRLDDLL